ncbi:radical SAM protein [Cystobacter fuscus]
MTDRVRPYLFYDTAISICSTCYQRVEGKILFADGRVLLQKRCPRHGFERVLLADDVDYYKRSREIFIKPPEQPLRYNTPIRYGCPYDCGLCPDHEQHSCLTLVELTDHCNLRCPICYAESGPERQTHRSFEKVVSMLDAVVANEGEPDVVQLSGGEPTLHPDFFRILEEARARPIRHLMVNTNGIRIARDEALRREAGHLPQGIGGLPPVRLPRARAAHGPARRGSALGAATGARAPQCAGREHHAGGDAEEGAQRRGDRPHPRLRGPAALRARRHLPTRAGGRSAGGV